MPTAVILATTITATILAHLLPTLYLRIATSVLITTAVTLYAARLHHHNTHQHHHYRWHHIPHPPTPADPDLDWLFGTEDPPCPSD